MGLDENTGADELERLQRQLLRSSTLAALLREGHRLADEELPAEQLPLRLLRVLMSGLDASSGAVLRCDRNGALGVRAAVALDRAELEEMAAPNRLGNFHVVQATAVDAPVTRFLLHAAGGPRVLWARDSRTRSAVLLRVPACDPRWSLESDEERGLLEEFLALLAELGERRLKLRMLRESEERFRSFVENMGDVAFRADLDGRVTYVNRMARELTGIPDEEIIGSNFLELFEPRSVERAAAAHAKLMAGESQEDEVVFANGATVHVVAEPIRDSSGAVVGVFGTARDITRRAHEEEFLRKLVENSLQGLIIIQDGKLVFVNQAMAEMVGGTPSAMLSRPAAELLGLLVHAEDREMVWSRFLSRAQGEDPPSRYEFRMVGQDGTVVPAEILACRTVFRGRPAVQAALMVSSNRA